MTNDPAAASPISAWGPFILGGIFVALGALFLASGRCSGYWALGFGLIAIGVGAKLRSLARVPELTWRGDGMGWAVLAALTMPGAALIVVGAAGLTSSC